MSENETEQTVRIGDVARALHVSPRVLTAAFYDRVIPQAIVDQCPIRGNKREIPLRLIPAVLEALMGRGGVRSRVPSIR